MTQSAISIEGISKRYQIGASLYPAYGTLRDRIAGVLTRPMKTPTSEVWALKDINLEVNEGEALGLIGHNGAGKSTLLKILTRITEPTHGRITLRGRVASLLEVGTGFHPELTGRENIFLNGAILGMTRPEIRRNFDAIVAFSEIGQFLDTPVKRYSSGMYVRLAFAVAAHLTPEILLIDEVLAVGDIEFQRRCLGRMNEVARSGRTVVFVSHNLESIERLCSRAVLLERGAVVREGSSASVISHYLSGRGRSAMIDLSSLPDRNGTGRARITGVEILSKSGEPLDAVEFLRPFRVRIRFEAKEALRGVSFGFGLLSARGERVFLTESYEKAVVFDLPAGTGVAECFLAAPNVLPGIYRLELLISDNPGISAADHISLVGEIEVTMGEMPGASAAVFTTSGRGTVYVDGVWSLS